jgi:response regulator RpfG family c-di-GMP phosphodiesterase
MNKISPISRRKCIVIYDDRKTLQPVRETARHWYDVLDTQEPEHAIQLLEAHPDVSIFITHSGAGEFDCIGLLEQVRAGYPDVRRIVMTSYQELARIVQGLHSGTIQKLVQKPIDTVELQQAILPFQVPAAGVAAGIQKLADNPN